MIPVIISRIFDPFIGLSVLFCVAGLRSGVIGWDFVFLMSIFFLTIILPPAVFLLWAVKTGRVSNWDISNQKQRVRALLVFVLFLVFDYFFIQRIGTPLMKQVFIFLLFSFFGFFVITVFWKISGHMTTATLVIALLLYWYGWSVFPLFLLLLPLGWSRITLKRHTVGEILGGVVYASTIFFLAIYFGLL